MKNSFKTDFKDWLLTTAISAALFTGGFFGQIMIKNSKIMKISDQRTDIEAELSQLADDSVVVLTHKGLVDAESLKQMEELSNRIAQLDAELEQKPQGDADRKARNQLHSQRYSAKKELQSQKVSITEKLMSSETPGRAPPVVLKYKEKHNQLHQINQMGWLYSDASAIGLFFIDILCNLIMILGMLGLFLFGVLGFISMIGQIE